MKEKTCTITVLDVLVEMTEHNKRHTLGKAAHRGQNPGDMNATT